MCLGFSSMLAAPLSVMAHPGLHHDIERVTASMQTESDKAGLFVERGYYYRLEGDLKASLSDLDEAIRLDPDAIASYAQRGLTLSELGRFKQAEADFNRFIGAGGLSSPVLLARAGFMPAMAESPRRWRIMTRRSRSILTSIQFLSGPSSWSRTANLPEPPRLSAMRFPD